MHIHIFSIRKRYAVFSRSFFILAIIFLLSGFYPAISAQVDSPQIVKQNGQKALLLPDRLLESIKKHFHNFSIPTEADMTTGSWLEEKEPNPFPYISWGDFDGDGLIDVAVLLLREEQKEHAKHGEHGKQGRHDRKWEFVIFHQNAARDYKPVYELDQRELESIFFDKRQGSKYKNGYKEKKDRNHPQHILLPQEVVLRTVKQGVGWAPEGGDVPTEYKHEFDAISFSIYVETKYATQAHLSLIYWENGKYHRYDE